MTEIKLEGGITVKTFEPPAGFDPFTAKPSDVVGRGFPERPVGGENLERYKRVIGQLKRKANYIVPTFRVNDKFHGPRKRLTTEGTETSTNWSGGVIFAPSGQSFKWIQGDWVVPNVDAPTQNQWYYCASWIGIDGDRSGDVCQAGVECEVYRSGSSITRNIYPWWEWFPHAEVGITNFQIDPGDMVTMLICTAGANSTSASVFFANRTTGASTSLSFNAPSGTKLVGNSAEWIVEAPTVGGSQSALADYGEVFFSVCQAELTNNSTVDVGTGDTINMTAGGSTVSTGTIITPTILQCQYVGALPTA